MYKEKKIIAIVTARGGSKGLPKKNIKKINEKPLICWTLERAYQSKLIDEVFISTDSNEIKRVCNNYGYEVTELRPKKLAEDDTPSSDVIIHVLDLYEKNKLKFDYVLLLEPTSPLRKENDIDNAIMKLIDNHKAQTLISVGEVQTEHPAITKKINYNDNYVEPYYQQKIKFHQRQQLDKAYFPYGVVYMSTVSYFRNNKTFYSTKTIPYFIERWQNYEIDDEIDFYINELLIKKFL